MHWVFVNLYFCLTVLKMELRASHRQGNCSTTDTQPQPLNAGKKCSLRQTWSGFLLWKVKSRLCLFDKLVCQEWNHTVRYRCINTVEMEMLTQIPSFSMVTILPFLSQFIVTGHLLPFVTGVMIFVGLVPQPQSLSNVQQLYHVSFPPSFLWSQLPHV